MQILEVITSLLNQAFYPSEHIAWLRQKQIIQGEPGGMLILGLIIWTCSLVVGIVKYVMFLSYNLYTMLRKISFYSKTSH